MKLFLITIHLLLCSLFTATAQDSIQVQINIQQAEKAPVLVFYTDGNTAKTVAGTEIAPNKYLVKLPNHGYIPFKFMVNSPQNMHISPTGFTPKPMPNLIASPNKTLNINVLEGDQLQLEVVSDDPEIKLFETFAEQERAYQQLSFSHIQKATKVDTQEQQTIHQTKIDFVKDHTDSYAALAVFASYYMSLPASEASLQLSRLATKHRTNPLYLELAEKLKATQQATKGTKIPYFEAKSLNGKIFRSDQLEGQYYLLDFWGSWCQPCRASHPGLRKLYEKYHSKGLEILGIAFESGTQEEQEKKWKKAIAEDQINWKHILNHADNNIVKLFGVSSYPTKILVDPSGNIIYRSGQGQGDLNEILKKIFDNTKTDRDQLLSYLNELLNANTTESKQTLYKEAQKLTQTDNESDLLLAKKIYKELGEEETANKLTAQSLKNYPKGITAREEAANKFLAKLDNESVVKTEQAYQHWLKEFPPTNFNLQNRGFYDMVLLQLLKHFGSKGEFEIATKYKDTFLEQSLRTVSYYNLADYLLKEGKVQESRNYLDSALNWSHQARTSNDAKTKSSFGALMYPNIALLYSQVSLELKDPSVAINLLPPILNDGKYQVMQADKMVLLLADAYQQTDRDLDAFLTLEEQAKINDASSAVWDSLEQLYTKLNTGKGVFSTYKKQIQLEKEKAQFELLKSKMVKKDFPAFELYNRKGELVRLNDFKGKIVILDFWATWCVPCIRSFPAMQKLIKQYKNKDVVFLFINTWEKQANFKQAVDKLITENAYDFEVLYDELSDTKTSLLSNQVGVPSLPTKIVLDKEGKMRFMISGSDPEEEAVTREINNLIKLVQGN